ncbi:MAG: hypothetical protein AVDCRST_MAG09-644 [uncultured Sphingomonas sp.]|uniref:EF-hand domain-containing protein n=1 Tax=uncultured Sphingomonas sp. TaxID=158754 RepID=A0A6J4S3K0_9SPHN|nr:EF-hand domain-containing protein [uncultured Sphingomonas sp.]CAA9487854.1 MAG: hypothetical protein AVDCRST_MAG09-644 [uncultured Sphingomonas sp.]
MSKMSIAAGAVLAVAASVAASAQTPHQHGGGNGAHSRAEFVQQIQQVFARLDANRDGFITRAEAGAGAAQGGQLFAMADANRDNRVSLSEATGVATQHFDHADANRDGQVTREEWQKMRKHMPARG